MVEPYFNTWLGVDKAERNATSTIKRFREVWQSMKMHERIVISLFFLLDLVMIALGVFAQFNLSFLFLYGLAFMLFLILAGVANNVSIALHRRRPEYSVKRAIDFSQSLLAALQEVGIENNRQIKLLRDEAVRILDRKERIRASVVRYTFDIVVLVTLAATFNNIANLLEHGMSLETVIEIIAFDVVAAIIVILLVHGLLVIYDRLSPLPVPKLRSFAEDLTSLMICQIGENFSYRNFPSRAVMKRTLK